MSIKSAVINIIRRNNYAISPRKAVIEITEKCNLNCPMCPRKITRVSGEDMSINNFKCILDQLPLLKHVMIMGRGEVLLHPNLFELLNLGKSRGIHFTITTNGTLLTEDKIRRLNNVSVIESSIDSPNKEVYKKIRGADLESVVSNLEKVKKTKKGVYLRIQGVIMDDNIDDLPDFIPMVKRIGADELRLFSLVAFNKDIDKWKNDNKKAEKLNEKLKQTKDLAEKEGTKLVVTSSINKPRVCTEPWLQPRIALNGNVYSCCYMYITLDDSAWQEWFCGSNLEVPQAQYKMGNIFKDSFAKIWNSSDYRLLRKTVRKVDENCLLPSEEIVKMRKDVNLKKGRFSYCKHCLLKQNRVC